jgi:RNA polymerase sigma-70 factor (ECF subfamily)
MARHRLFRRLERERSLVSLTGSDGETTETAYAQLRSINDPFGELARNETINVVRLAILSLPANFREVVVLCYLQEMNYADAAEVIDCPIGTVRSRLARARALLTNKLSELATDTTAKVKTEPVI